jgi:exonuclease III
MRIHTAVDSWIVFAVWAQKPEGHDCYTEQVWNAVHYYSDILNQDKVIIFGDFNSSTIWDRPNRLYNHSNLVEFLETKNMLSAYHSFRGQVQGKEKDSTLFLYRRSDRGYHIDYCFASRSIIRGIFNVDVGRYEDWVKYSDHCPLIVDFV